MLYSESDINITLDGSGSIIRKDDNPKLSYINTYTTNCDASGAALYNIPCTGYIWNVDYNENNMIDCIYPNDGWTCDKITTNRCSLSVNARQQGKEGKNIPFISFNDFIKKIDKGELERTSIKGVVAGYNEAVILEDQCSSVSLKNTFNSLQKNNKPKPTALLFNLNKNIRCEIYAKYIAAYQEKFVDNTPVVIVTMTTTGVLVFLDIKDLYNIDPKENLLYYLCNYKFD